MYQSVLPSANSPLKLGHLSNQDTLTGPKGGWIRESPLYVGLGCAVKMKRRDRAAHEQDDKVHLHMAMDTISTRRIYEHKATPN